VILPHLYPILDTELLAARSLSLTAVASELRAAGVTLLSGSVIFGLIEMIAWPFVLRWWVYRAAEKQRAKFRDTLPRGRARRCVKLDVKLQGVCDFRRGRGKHGVTH